VIKYKAMAAARAKLSRLAWKYNDRGFSLDVYDYDTRQTAPRPSEFKWPVYGFLSVSHGTPPYMESLWPPRLDWTAAGQSVYSVKRYLTAMPDDTKGEYGFGLLFVHSCYAANQPWLRLAAHNAAHAYVAHNSLNLATAFPSDVGLPRQ
jgi:hypothetical protein